MDPNRILYRSGLFTLGEFRCPPENPRWREVNVNGMRPLVAFPGTSVVIHQQRQEPVLANSNHVIFYGGGQHYRRLLHDERGDHCLFVEIGPRFARELGVAGGSIPFVDAPSDPRAYLRLRLAASTLHDSLSVEEAVYEAVGRSLEAGAAVHGRRRAAVRARTEHDHHQLVERTKALLTERAPRHDTLERIARQVHASEFHLARVFRDRTGFTLHGYRTHLRLRLALERLRAETDIATIASELGFNSHSHFTDAFRCVFGVPPSEARRDLRELRRMLEAQLTHHS
jgi:AraC family transcriptional regulator